MIILDCTLAFIVSLSGKNESKKILLTVDNESGDRWAYRVILSTGELRTLSLHIL